MGFAQVAPKIVMFLNTLTMIMGIVMFAGAIFVSVTPEYSAFFPTYSIWVAGAAGILIFFVSLFGCVVVYKDYRKSMALYTLLVLLILGMQIAGAYLYSSYYNIIQAGAADGFSAPALTNPDAIELNNAILSVYTVCCTGCSLTALCTTPYNEGVPTDTDYCTLLTCLPALKCLVIPQPTCYQSTDSSDPEIPSFKVDPAICTNLATTSINSTSTVKFVGNSLEGGCGGGVPVNFQTSVYKYANSKLVWVLGIAAFVAALEFLLLIASIAALCAKRERKN